MKIGVIFQIFKVQVLVDLMLYGYSCCETTTDVVYTDNDGKWGIEKGNWCGINVNVNVNQNN